MTGRRFALSHTARLLSWPRNYQGTGTRLMVNPNTRTRRLLGRYAVALAGVGIITIGVLLTTRNKHLSADSLSATIGLNLIASVILAVIFSVIITRIQERVQS